MKNNAIMQNRTLLLVALSGVLLVAVAGCICVKVEVGGQPYAGPGANQGGGPVSAPAGGNFVPVQATLASSGSLTVCGQAVSGTFVRFYPPTQIPPSGYTSFRGYLWNATTSTVIPNTDYLLQWFVTSANYGCCTDVAGSSTDVTCPVTAGLSYRFTAFFFTGKVPTGSPTIQINGAWIQ